MNFNSNANISIKGLSFTFKLRKQRTLKAALAQRFSRNEEFKHVLKNINFEAVSGDRVAIIGKNGAGKSTLLKIISRVYPPQNGTVSVTGNIAPLIQIGSTFQSHLTGRENVELFASYINLNKNDEKCYVEKVIDFAELGDDIEKPISVYSSGMVSKLSFSIAMLYDADILLMDEVFAVGDISFIKKAQEKMREKINTANILCLVTHDLSFCKQVCNKAIVLFDEQIVFEGSVDKAIEFYEKLCG